MFRIVIIACIVAFLLGCATPNVDHALDNLSKDCDRHYMFSLSTGGVAGVGASATVSGTADCKHELAQPAVGAGVPSPANPSGGFQP